MDLSTIMQENRRLVKSLYYIVTAACLAFSAWALSCAYVQVNMRLRYWACVGAFVVGYTIVAVLITLWLKGAKRYWFHTVTLQIIPFCAALSLLSLLPSRSEKRRGSNVANRYELTFNDLQKVQKKAAIMNGVEPFKSREEFDKRRDELCEENKLVKISSNSKYIVRKLSYSVPYVVPKMAELLEDMATAFQAAVGSETRFEVTSVLRTVEDVAKLQRGNANASSNSCHCNATTVDISYSTLGDTNDKERLALAKVVSDLRNAGRCYVKFERNQRCYHITVR